MAKLSSVKGAFNLDIETVTIVPSTQNITTKISAQQFKSRIIETKRFLENNFGGYTSWRATSWRAQGGYIVGDKEVPEQVALVTAFAERKVFEAKKKKWIAWVRRKKKEWGQDSMGIIIENDLRYI